MAKFIAVCGAPGSGKTSVALKVAQELGDTGRILVRESGTEPVIRVMVEAPTKEQCQKCVDSVVDVICAQGHARV